MGDAVPHGTGGGVRRLDDENGPGPLSTASPPSKYVRVARANGTASCGSGAGKLVPTLAEPLQGLGMQPAYVAELTSTPQHEECIGDGPSIIMMQAVMSMNTPSPDHSKRTVGTSEPCQLYHGILSLSLSLSLDKPSTR